MPHLKPLFAVLALALVCAGCATALAPTVPLADYVGGAALPLPPGWQLGTNGPGTWQEAGLTESWVCIWEPPDPTTTFRFRITVERYDSVSRARGAYRRSLKIMRQPGLDLVPSPTFNYRSAGADEYTCLCASPHVGSMCHALGRYRNLVIYVSLNARGGATLDDVPKLFGALDRHVLGLLKGSR